MAKTKNSVASQPQNSTSLTTFTLFPKLFPELRSKIWELAIFNDPRNIIIGKYRPWKEREGYPRWSEDFGYKCTSTVPAVLRACTEARTQGLEYYKLLEWVPETSKGKARLVTVPEHPARTYINWKVDRIVIDHVEDFWTNSLCVSDYKVGKVHNFRKLHDDDRSAAYDLAQKFIENGVKFLAVDTGNDSDRIKFFFERVYPWGCPVEELIFFSSGQTKFTSRFLRTWGLDRYCRGVLFVNQNPLTLFSIAQKEKRPLYTCAPMVRYSKLAFRETVAQYGVDLCWTPMILAKEFNRSVFARDSDFTTSPTSGPTIAQFGVCSPLEISRSTTLLAPT
ncbi:putative dihydrouridine synthase protein [Botrytis fragariae]|uniref:Putative dihydrouridine synthase protein n=1 Tax=Botrytis fragariae TaxID=1964551 RepID=A0A8H6AFD8_9HELO|nr:putative dihydrouridine synthase protein [Botrytis fragariae]KAF5867442.1 putative dihydrouridine synthase protein [Botrytis fragariae]